ESRFTFWGTGGAARACGVYFASAGAKEINLVNRTVSKAEKLAEDILKANSSCTVNCLGLDEHSAIQSAFNASDVIIQSTSIGLHADDECSIPLGFMDKGMNIFEMIYRPTLLLSEAEKMGCNVIDGKGMLLYQGVKSFSIWNGIENSPVDAMREGLRQALL
ncbi:MAG: hypothetical protein HRT89_14990, partial [Lentisphaeria bacterium]|nr:hypothetical protein [Lentisphaeria bacterium]NQZ69366.1 hypothetical protein [Lentisphaeria bacterium]